ALAAARVLRGAWSEAADAFAILVEPGQVFDDPGPALQLLGWVFQQLIRAHSEPVDDDVCDRLRRLASAGAPAEIGNLAGFSALVEAGDLLDHAPTAAAPYAALCVAAERGVVLTIGSTFLLERVLGVSATRARSWMDAERHFTAAAATAERIGAGPELAHTCLDHARMLIARNQAGDRERATALLPDAHARSERLGLIPPAERIRQVAPRLPIPPTPRARRGAAPTSCGAGPGAAGPRRPPPTPPARRRRPSNASAPSWRRPGRRRPPRSRRRSPPAARRTAPGRSIRWSSCSPTWRARQLPSSGSATRGRMNCSGRTMRSSARRWW